MPIPNHRPHGEAPVVSPPATDEVRRTTRIKSVFFDPDGIRAGWRLLIFAGSFAGFSVGVGLLRAGGPHAWRVQYANQSHLPMMPGLLIESEAIALLLLCVSACIMGRIEHHRLSVYGLPLQCALRRDFWFGAALGFGTITGTLFALFLLHGFRVTGLALHRTAIVYSVVGWAAAFMLSSLVEEFLFRGYVQYTLASRIGFWPAAVLTSALFGLGHACNANETVIGAMSVVMFGLLLCLFLRRTRNLWCAVGFHLAYDWGQMFYGVADSGIAPYQNVLHSSLSGPEWLTGGAVGPEASLLTPLALLVAGVIFIRRYRTVGVRVQGTCKAS